MRRRNVFHMTHPIAESDSESLDELVKRLLTPPKREYRFRLRADRGVRWARKSQIDNILKGDSGNLPKGSPKSTSRATFSRVPLEHTEGLANRPSDEFSSAVFFLSVTEKERYDHLPYNETAEQRRLREQHGPRKPSARARRELDEMFKEIEDLEQLNLEHNKNKKNRDLLKKINHDRERIRRSRNRLRRRAIRGDNAASSWIAGTDRQITWQAHSVNGIVVIVNGGNEVNEINSDSSDGSEDSSNHENTLGELHERARKLAQPIAKHNRLVERLDNNIRKFWNGDLTQCRWELEERWEALREKVLQYPLQGIFPLSKSTLCIYENGLKVPLPYDELKYGTTDEELSDEDPMLGDLDTEVSTISTDHVADRMANGHVATDSPSAPIPTSFFFSDSDSHFAATVGGASSSPSPYSTLKNLVDRSVDAGSDVDAVPDAPFDVFFEAAADFNNPRPSSSQQLSTNVPSSALSNHIPSEIVSDSESGSVHSFVSAVDADCHSSPARVYSDYSPHARSDTFAHLISEQSAPIHSVLSSEIDSDDFMDATSMPESEADTEHEPEGRTPHLVASTTLRSQLDTLPSSEAELDTPPDSLFAILPSAHTATVAVGKQDSEKSSKNHSKISGFIIPPSKSREDSSDLFRAFSENCILPSSPILAQEHIPTTISGRLSKANLKVSSEVHVSSERSSSPSDLVGAHTSKPSEPRIVHSPSDIHRVSTPSTQPEIYEVSDGDHSSIEVIDISSEEEPDQPMATSTQELETVKSASPTSTSAAETPPVLAKNSGSTPVRQSVPDSETSIPSVKVSPQGGRTALSSPAKFTRVKLDDTFEERSESKPKAKVKLLPRPSRESNQDKGSCPSANTGSVRTELVSANGRQVHSHIIESRSEEHESGKRLSYGLNQITHSTVKTESHSKTPTKFSDDSELENGPWLRPEVNSTSDSDSDAHYEPQYFSDADDRQEKSSILKHRELHTGSTGNGSARSSNKNRFVSDTAHFISESINGAAPEQTTEHDRIPSLTQLMSYRIPKLSQNVPLETGPESHQKVRLPSLAEVIPNSMENTGYPSKSSLPAAIDPALFNLTLPHVALEDVRRKRHIEVAQASMLAADSEAPTIVKKVRFSPIIETTIPSVTHEYMPENQGNSKSRHFKHQCKKCTGRFPTIGLLKRHEDEHRRLHPSSVSNRNLFNGTG